MKKTGKAVILVCGLILLLTACSKDGVQSDTGSETDSETAADLMISEGKDILSADPGDSISFIKGIVPSDYVTLSGDYRKIDIPAADLEVSEEDVQKQVDEFLLSHRIMETVEGRSAQNGDILELRLNGTMQDQVIIDEDHITVILGSSGILPGFDEQLEGAGEGDLVKMDLEYGDDYSDEYLRGQTVHLEAKILKLYLPVIPDYTDEFVAANTSFESIAKYEKALKKKLQETRKKDAVALWMAEHSSLQELPESVLKGYQDSLVQHYTQIAEKEYGMSFEELLKKLKYQTRYEFLEDNRENMSAAVQSDLAYAIVADEQKISSTVKDYLSYLNAYAEDNGFAGAEELLDYFSESEMRKYYMKDLVAEWILEHSGVR